MTITANKIFDIPNVHQTSDFKITASYGNTKISETSTFDLHTFSPLPEIAELHIKSIEFYPKNEGLAATYIFSIQSSLEILTGYKIVVWFPDDFDDSLTLTESIECWAEPQEVLGNKVSCVLSSFKKVIITGFNSISKDLLVSLYIGKVVNPSSGQLGKFKFALKNTEDDFLLYTTEVGNLSIKDHPQPLKIVDMVAEYKYARILNDFSFQFSPATSIPSDLYEGKIWIDLGPDYELKNLGTAWEYPCYAITVQDYDVESD